MKQDLLDEKETKLAGELVGCCATLDQVCTTSSEIIIKTLFHS